MIFVHLIFECLHDFIIIVVLLSYIVFHKDNQLSNGIVIIGDVL